MTQAGALIAEAVAAGVTLAHKPPGGLSVRFTGPRPEALLDRIKVRKPGIIAVLAGTVCPACARGLDDRRRCWWAFNAACAGCDQPTSSATMAYCSSCRDRLANPPEPGVVDPFFDRLYEAEERAGIAQFGGG